MIAKTRPMTVEEYFAYDEASDVRHEYIDGDVYPMTGGTGDHGAIIAYVIMALGAAIGERDCVVRAGTVRVIIDETKYVYPDVSVVCGESVYLNDDGYNLINPLVIVEVTSPSSFAHDHGRNSNSTAPCPASRVTSSSIKSVSSPTGIPAPPRAGSCGNTAIAPPAFPSSR